MSYVGTTYDKGNLVGTLTWIELRLICDMLYDQMAGAINHGDRSKYDRLRRVHDKILSDMKSWGVKIMPPTAPIY